MFPSPIATREEGKIYRAVTGASGRLLAVVMDTLDGEVHLLDALGLSPGGTLLLGAMRTARGCALDPRDEVLAAATHDDVRAFDLATGAMRWSSPLLGDEPAVAFSPDGARVAAGASAGGYVILSARDGAHVTTAELPYEARALAWDARGIVALGARGVASAAHDGAVARSVSLSDARDEGSELALVGADRVAVAGAAPQGVWLEIRDRKTLAVVNALSLEEDRRAEGLCFSGGVIFLATEGGVYRADPPFEQLVRWLPPLGGTHDPTRVAAVAEGHVATVARDVRVFRTRS